MTQRSRSSKDGHPRTPQPGGTSKSRPPQLADAGPAGTDGKAMTAPLPNPRHELFAQELAKGQTADAAYALAGFKPHRGNAARLSANESVQARVSTILAAGAERAEVTVEQVIRELAKIGFADIRKVVRWNSNVLATTVDDDGKHHNYYTSTVELIDAEDIDDETAGAIAEISQTDKGGLKVKLHDKRAALVDIGKHLGMFPTNLRVGDPNGDPLPASQTNVLVYIPHNGRDEVRR